MQSATWFVVLSQSSMKLFSRDKAHTPLKHFKTLKNESEDQAIPGPAAEAQDFAREMADYLDSQRCKDQFRELHVAAEPRFMGRFKKSLTTETEKMVREWVNKDLEKATTERLAEEFEGH